VQKYGIVHAVGGGQYSLLNLVSIEEKGAGWTAELLYLYWMYVSFNDSLISMSLLGWDVRWCLDYVKATESKAALSCLMWTTVLHASEERDAILNLKKKYTFLVFSFKRQSNETHVALQQSLPLPLLRGTAVTEMFQLPGLPTQGCC
jgi:hypothetical protein